jgi:PAS domain S-box-containing protein
VTSKKILIIDDSAIDARLTAKMLTEAGYETIVAYDGPGGIELARALLPDMILLDVSMPKMDGYQVCQHLKSDPVTREMLTVLYTVRDQFIDCLKGIEAGADDFLTKTPNKEAFLNRVKSIFAERLVGSETQTQWLNLKPIALLAEVQDREDLVRTWYSAFNKHLRQVMSVILGSHPTAVLVDRAMDKASAKYPIFPRADLGQRATFMFDPRSVGEAPVAQLIDGFQTFISELYQLAMKLTRTRVNGSVEARSITKGFQEMLNELNIEHERAAMTVQERALPSAPAVVSVGPVDDRGQARESRDVWGRWDEEAPAPPPARPTPAFSPSVGFSPPPSTPQLECTLDAQGVMIYTNDDLAQVLGYGKMDLMGRPFAVLLTESSQTRFEEALGRLKEKGVSDSIVQLRTREAASLHAALRLTALYDPQGNFVMSRCSAHVVSEAELLQEKDLEIEQLRQAMRRTNDEFAHLASIISHDLRQPLHAILVLCQFLQEEYADRLEDRGREYLNSIEKAGARLRQMVEDLVHYARITSTSNTYDEVDLNQLLEEVKETLAAQLSERNASLLRKGELPVVSGDRDRLRELLVHLVSNGIKFNDKAQPAVVVSLARKDAGEYTFSVWDNGIGIEEAYHESIFQPFQRLHKPEEYGGTGIGLAICRRIVDAHTGKIWVRSQPNEGATFFFTLPA